MYAHIKKKEKKWKLSKGCVHNQLLIKYNTELSNYAQKKIKKLIQSTINKAFNSTYSYLAQSDGNQSN